MAARKFPVTIEMSVEPEYQLDKNTGPTEEIASEQTYEKRIKQDVEDALRSIADTNVLAISKLEVGAEEAI